MNGQELVPAGPGQQVIMAASSDEMQRFMPVMSVQAAIDRRKAISEAIRTGYLEEGIDADYGKIPGTKKNTLFQPGADKLNCLFGLVPRFEVEYKELDFTGAMHGGEAFIYYEARCILQRGDAIMGEGLGSATSWESKYRYRNRERTCPQCGQPAIIKGKPEYGGGWLCYKAKGGCCAKFKVGDGSIEDQPVGKETNRDVADVANTVLKIACKRAKVSATLNATGAHDFFTPDMDDVTANAEAAAEERGESIPTPRQQTPASQPPPEQNVTPQRQTTAPPEILTLWNTMDAERKQDPKYGPLSGTFASLKDRVQLATGSTDIYYDGLKSVDKKKSSDFNFANKEEWRLAQKAAAEILWNLTKWQRDHTPVTVTEDRNDWLPASMQSQPQTEDEEYASSH